MGGGAAHAVVFVVGWDPLFNPDFTAATGVELGWTGTSSINVDPGCVSPGATVNFPDGCGTASLIGYGYTLYDTLPANVLFSGGGVGDLSPDPNVVRFDAAGVVDGFTLDAPGSFELFGGPFNIGGFDFVGELDFVITPDYAGPRLTLSRQICDGDSCFIQSFASDISGADSVYRPAVTWSRIPEPASLVLVGLALFAAGAAAKTRRR